MKLAAIILAATCSLYCASWDDISKAAAVAVSGITLEEHGPVAADSRQRPVVRDVPVDADRRPVIAMPIGAWAPEFRCNLILLADQRQGIPPEFWTAVGAKDGGLPVDVRILAADGTEVRRLTVRVPLRGVLIHPLPTLTGPHTVLVLQRPGLMQWAMVSLIDNTSNDPTSVIGVAALVEVEP